MIPYNPSDEEEIRKVNRIQRDYFSHIVHLFDTPLPQGVPARLKKVVAAANIAKGDIVLDVGTGTGILIPLIQEYLPGKIFACDLSGAMLARLKEKHPEINTLLADARDLTLPSASIDVVLINACYSNIVDKDSTFANISRMMKPGGRTIISHPMGRSFIDSLRKKSPFPLDDLPGRSQAQRFLGLYGLVIKQFVDEPKLYILVALKTERD